MLHPLPTTSSPQKKRKGRDRGLDGTKPHPDSGAPLSSTRNPEPGVTISKPPSCHGHGGPNRRRGRQDGGGEEGCTQVVPGSCGSPKPVFPVPLPPAPRPPTRCLTSLHKKQLERKRLENGVGKFWLHARGCSWSLCGDPPDTAGCWGALERGTGPFSAK